MNSFFTSFLNCFSCHFFALDDDDDVDVKDDGVGDNNEFLCY